MYHCTPFSHLICFSSQITVIWCAGVNLDFVKILTVFFGNQGAYSAHSAMHSAHFTLFSQRFCFSSQKAAIWCANLVVIWCAGMNLDFVIILIQYFLAIRVCRVHILHCTLHTVFPTFLFFKLESCSLVCRREFRFCKHSYTLFFDKQGVHSAPQYDQS